MEIKNSKILVLGGWGLVGSAICKKLLRYKPSQLIVTSLRESESKEAVESLKKEHSDFTGEIIPKWGNVFTRTEWKDLPPGNYLSDKNSRNGFIRDVFSDLDDDITQKSALYDLIEDTKPDIIIDCINTATAIAYLDTFKQTNNVLFDIENDSLNEENVEKLVASSYIPQLIRHIQILNKAMSDHNTGMYMKIGTTGTGGMGMNIPYTHSEERPSRVLMSKTAVAGAQSMLLYLLARTPDSTIVKEIKPGAAIAWKKIGFGNIKKSGKDISLVDMKPDNAKTVNGKFSFNDKEGVEETNKVLQSVYIDTGENGIFSRGEFEAISSIGQMEIVTPEEIADYTIFELRGGNTGKDFIQGLDAFTLGPTYRGGVLRSEALKRIADLESKHDIKSVAFELLGPPRLSKLLHEANILREICGSLNKVLEMTSLELQEKANELIRSNSKLRSEILSIGLPILLANNTYLRGSTVKIPVQRQLKALDFNDENIEQWCFEGWIDLREKNFENWKERILKIKNQARSVDENDSSSGNTYDPEYWDNFQSIEPGKIAGWIFEKEDRGWRFKR